MIKPKFYVVEMDDYSFQQVSLIAESQGITVDELCRFLVDERCNALFPDKPKKARKNASRKVQCTRGKASRKVQCTRAVYAGIRIKERR